MLAVAGTTSAVSVSGLVMLVLPAQGGGGVWTTMGAWNGT
jgi:hypothetical protein